AKTAAGCYSVAAEYQPGKGFIGYRVTQSVADKRRVIASSLTVDEGKALAQRDYEQGDADERTRQALQPITIRVPLGRQNQASTSENRGVKLFDHSKSNRKHRVDSTRRFTPIRPPCEGHHPRRHSVALSFRCDDVGD